MNFKSFITRGYWLDMPVSLTRDTTILYIVILGAMFMLGIAARVAQGRTGIKGYMRAVFRRFGNLFFTGSVFGFVILFLRYEYVPVLSLRLWFGIWALALLAWFVSIFVGWMQGASEYKKRI